jgi:hypothetical protein
MKKRERKARLAHLRPYVAELQVLLRLQHWEIFVMPDRPPDNALADNCCYMRQYRNDVRFSDRFFAKSREEQRETTVHELLHIVVEHWYRSTRAAFEGLSSTSQEWATERNEHEMEMCVDQLSRILAPLLPLPPPFAPPDEAEE